MATRNNQLGFTLIELMITVAIVGIIAAIALPSYQESVRRTKRVTAAACLSEYSQIMERTFTSALTYSGASLPAIACQSDLSGIYNFAFATGQPTGTTYVIEATPAGAQAGDTKCATLGINQAGVKTVTGTKTVADCWR